MGPILGKTHLLCHLFNFPTIERPPPYHQEMLTSPCKGKAHVPYYHFFLGTFVHQDVSTFLLPVKTPFVLHCADLHRSTLAQRAQRHDTQTYVNVSSLALGLGFNSAMYGLIETGI